MPRYFFDIEGEGFPEADEEGTLLDGPEQARLEVAALAGDLLRQSGGEFWARGRWLLRVTDEAGATVCELSVTGSAGVGDGATVGDQGEPRRPRSVRPQHNM